MDCYVNAPCHALFLLLASTCLLLSTGSVSAETAYEYCNSFAPIGGINNSYAQCNNCTRAGCTYCNEAHPYCFYSPYEDDTQCSYTMDGKGVCGNDWMDDDDTELIIIMSCTLGIPTLISLGIVLYCYCREKGYCARQFPRRRNGCCSSKDNPGSAPLASNRESLMTALAAGAYSREPPPATQPQPCGGPTTSASAAAGAPYLSVLKLLEAGYTAPQLRAAGFSPSQLHVANCSAGQLRNAGYTAKDLVTAEYSVSEVAEAGYSVEELRATGLSTHQLMMAGVSVDRL